MLAPIFSYLGISLPVILAIGYFLNDKEKKMKLLKLISFTLFTIIIAEFNYSCINTVPQIEKQAEGEKKPEAFQRRWSYISETSAVIYWQLEDISFSAKSYQRVS